MHNRGVSIVLYIINVIFFDSYNAYQTSYQTYKFRRLHWHVPPETNGPVTLLFRCVTQPLNHANFQKARGVMFSKSALSGLSIPQGQVSKCHANSLMSLYLRCMYTG